MTNEIGHLLLDKQGGSQYNVNIVHFIIYS